MDFSYIQRKIPFCAIQGQSFSATASAEHPDFNIVVSDEGGLHYKLVSESHAYSSTRYYDDVRELVVEAKTEMLSLSASIKKKVGDVLVKKEVFSSSFNQLTFEQYENGNYSIRRVNRMVSSQSELSCIGGRYFLMRRVGMSDPITVKFDKVEDAAYYMLLNIETVKSNKEEVVRLSRTIREYLALGEGNHVEIKRPIRLCRINSLLGRSVNYGNPKDNDPKGKGILLDIQISQNVDLMTDAGIIQYPKTGVWLS